MPGESARINGMKGGRPKAPHTLLAEQMRKRLVEKVHKRLDPMLDAQIGLATGINVVMVRDWETDKKTGEAHRTGKWVQVESASEIEDLLNGPQNGDDYYQIWTKTPDTNAGKNLLDQTIGKATETTKVDVTSGGISLSVLFDKSKSHGRD